MEYCYHKLFKRLYIDEYSSFDSSFILLFHIIQIGDYGDWGGCYNLGNL